MRRLVQEAYDGARRILSPKHRQLDTLANGVLEFEMLTGEEMKVLPRAGYRCGSLNGSQVTR